ncbi:hypothetical protein DPEC_G00000550 [Dallia pectoralis]|uniref:Uncharacterized protein n=1 Tax=Dallia pectoralis TaxID=75939 RepID=A0ACC2HIQ3_DALPE|nr:hypothetical protein DPEC_G00000550 [Dallia pectoralis]
MKSFEGVVGGGGGGSGLLLSPSLPCTSQISPGNTDTEAGRFPQGVDLALAPQTAVINRSLSGAESSLSARITAHQTERLAALLCPSPVRSGLNETSYLTAL